MSEPSCSQQRPIEFDLYISGEIERPLSAEFEENLVDLVIVSALNADLKEVARLADEQLLDDTEKTPDTCEAVQVHGCGPANVLEKFYSICNQLDQETAVELNGHAPTFLLGWSIAQRVEANTSNVLFNGNLIFSSISNTLASIKGSGGALNDPLHRIEANKMVRNYKGAQPSTVEPSKDVLTESEWTKYEAELVAFRRDFAAGAIQDMPSAEMQRNIDATLNHLKL